MNTQQWRLAHDKAMARGRMAYVRWRYNVPAKRGGRVRLLFRGKLGTIRSANQWGQLRIQVDGEQAILPYHPTWQLEYL